MAIRSMCGALALALAACSDSGPGGATPDAAIDARNADAASSVSTPCSAFPVTVALGETIDPQRRGAILCVNLAQDTCRLTTNTYFEPPEQCANPDTLLVFLSSTSASSVAASNAWAFEAASAGTLVQQNKLLSSIPISTAITAVVGDGTVRQQVTFTFEPAQMLTLTSYGAAP